MNPQEFEQQVARIIAVLEGRSGGRVTWNDRVPDPDNPDRLRQIDISIKRGDALSIIECRLHTRPQDVKWVEELYGRKASLRARMVIGVSGSGFTTGAWHKAKHLGVFLRDFQALNDEEIKSWGRMTKFRLAYIHFRRLSLFLVPTSFVCLPDPDPYKLLIKSNGEPWPLGEVFRDMANKLASVTDLKHSTARLQCLVKDLYVGSVPVPELILQVDWKWVYRDVRLPTVLALRGPEQTAENAEAVVEKNAYSRMETYHVPQGAFFIIDVSLAAPEPRSYLRRIYASFEKEIAISGVGMIGLGEEQVSLFPFDICICRRNTPEYRRLLNESDILKST
jgi:hypothetical protein